jgi:hypothetical protein
MPEQTAGPNTSIVRACVVMQVWICAVRLVVVGASCMQACEVIVRVPDCLFRGVDLAGINLAVMMS